MFGEIALLIRLLNSICLVLASWGMVSSPSLAAGNAPENGPEKRQRVEQREKMRGDMRQAWANMTPEEREALRREQPDVEDVWGLRSRSDVRPDELKPTRHSAATHRPLTPEEHHNLRRQLRDLSQEERR